MSIIYFADAVSKQSTIFKYYLFLSILFAAAPTAAVLLTDIFPLTSIYASLQSHKLDLSIAVLNLICLLGEYAPPMSSFVSTKFLVVNLDGLLDASSTNCYFLVFHYYIIILTSINQ